MSKFTVKISIEGGRFEVEGDASPYVPATGPSMANAGGDPAEGGLEEVTGVYLLGNDGKRVELPEFLQAVVDKQIRYAGTYDDDIMEALGEQEEQAKEDAAEAKADKIREEGYQ